MQRVCPHCGATSQQFLCADCGVRTENAEAPPPSSTHSERIPPDRPGTLPHWNGLVIGLMLAQGLYYVVRHLGAAQLLAAGGPGADIEFWAGPHGLVVQQVLQALALLAGAMFAGAGQRHALTVGALLGAADALLLIGLPAALGQAPPAVVLFGQPLVFAAVGAAGGWIGGRVWQPAPAITGLAGAGGRQVQEVLTTVLPDQPNAVNFEPVPWARLFIGAMLVAGGTLGARVIRDFLLTASGSGSSPEFQRSQGVVWAIAVFFQVFGGAVAGANARHGTSLGAWAGVVAAGVLTLAQTFSGLQLQTHDVLAWLLGVAVPDGSPAALVLEGIQVLALGAFGGWLGCLILPAVPPKSSLDPVAR
jgi:hypothetical protein